MFHVRKFKILWSLSSKFSNWLYIWASYWSSLSQYNAMLALYCVIIGKDSFVSPLAFPTSQYINTPFLPRQYWNISSVGFSDPVLASETPCMIVLLHAVMIFCITCPLLSQYTMRGLYFQFVRKMATLRWSLLATVQWGFSFIHLCVLLSPLWRIQYMLRGATVKGTMFHQV